MIRSNVPDIGQLVSGYCESVISGDRATGRYERMAVERHLRDLQEASARGWWFDHETASKACRFFPLYLRHSMGEWANEPFHLDPWQAFVWWCVQGWRSASDKTRRFRKCYVTVARKNGKTTFAAGACNQMAFFDFPREPVGRGFCAATKKEQAALLWSEAKRMIEASPRLQGFCKILGGNNLGGGTIIITRGEQNGTTFVPVGSDSRTQDGLNPTFVVKDEIHEWRQRHRGLHEKLSTGGASRRQPLEIIITTAGDDNSEIWAEEHEFSQRVVEAGSNGDVVDDTVFALICQIDEEDDPLDPAVWPKANPNWGVSVKPKYIEAQAAEAIAKPSAYNQFVRYHCNRRVASFDQAYPVHLWDRGREPFGEPQPGDLAFVSFDLGRANDWSGAAIVFPQKFEDGDGEDRWRYVIRTQSWCCDGVNCKIDYSQPPYSLWIRDGGLEYQKDNETMDHTPLVAWVLEQCSRYDVRSVPYDDTFAGSIGTDLLNSHGLPVFVFHQSFLRYTEPLTAFEAALTEGRIYHGNDPILNYQAGNCQIVRDPKGRMMLDKGNGQQWKKIDAMVAVIMAFGEAIYHTKNQKNDDVLIG